MEDGHISPEERRIFDELMAATGITRAIDPDAPRWPNSEIVTVNGLPLGIIDSETPYTSKDDGDSNGEPHMEIVDVVSPMSSPTKSGLHSATVIDDPFDILVKSSENQQIGADEAPAHAELGPDARVTRRRSLLGRLAFMRSAKSRNNHPSNEAAFLATKLDLRKTSLSPELSTSDPEVVLSDGEVALATLRAEKLLLDAGGRSGDAGILRKSSKTDAIQAVSPTVVSRRQLLNFRGKKPIKVTSADIAEQLALPITGIAPETIPATTDISRRKVVGVLAVGVAFLAARGLSGGLVPGIGEKSLRTDNGGAASPEMKRPVFKEVEVLKLAGPWVEQKTPSVMQWEKTAFEEINKFNAWAKAINKENPKLEPLPYGMVDTGLVLATIMVVSGGNPAIEKSTYSYKGLAQLSNEIGSTAVKDYQPLNPQHSILASVAHITRLMHAVDPSLRTDRTAWIREALGGNATTAGYDPKDTKKYLAKIIPEIYAQWSDANSPAFDTWSNSDDVKRLNLFSDARNVLVNEQTFTIDGKIKPENRLDADTIKRYSGK